MVKRFFYWHCKSILATMKSADTLILNQMNRSLFVRILAALLFTFACFLLFLIYFITFKIGYDLSKERDFVNWGKDLKSVLVFLILAIGSGFYLAKRKRIIFNSKTHKYKVEYYLGPFYWGHWSDYEALKMVGIFKNSKGIYEVNIWFTNSRHLKFERFHNEEDALAEAKYIAELFTLKVWNASDPKKGYYLD